MTGVPEPTLRAWERRYGIPSPQRTASGYRLYSLSEVEQVREMRSACEGGMSAAEAARWVRDRSVLASSLQSDPLGASDPFDYVRAAVVEAVVRFDDEGLEDLLRRVILLGPSTMILDRVVAPALRELGARWHAGNLSIAQEHFASQRLGKLLRDLMHLAAGGSGGLSGGRVVLACFADDEHELGLLGLGLRLSTWGLRPLFLGAKTPPSAIRTAVEATSPALVALSVTVAPERARARELVEDYANACSTVPWLVGGIGASAMADFVRERGGMLDPENPAALHELIRRATAEKAQTR